MQGMVLLNSLQNLSSQALANTFRASATTPCRKYLAMAAEPVSFVSPHRRETSAVAPCNAVSSWMVPCGTVVKYDLRMDGRFSFVGPVYTLISPSPSALNRMGNAAGLRNHARAVSRNFYRASQVKSKDAKVKIAKKNPKKKETDLTTQTLDEVKASMSGDMDAEEITKAYQAMKTMMLKAEPSLQTIQQAEQIFEGLSPYALKELPSFSPRHLRTLLGAHAQSSIALDSKLLAEVSKQLLAKLDRLNAQQIANSIWAFAKMGQLPGEDVVAGLSRQAVVVSKDFKSQDVANILWAFAKLGLRPGDDVVDSLSQQAVLISEEFNAESVAETMCAFATLGLRPDDDVVACLVDQTFLKSFSAQHVASTIWALAKLGLRPEDDVVDSLCQQTKRNYKDFSAQEVANTMWAFAALGLRPKDDFVARIYRQTVVVSKDFSAQNVAMTLWAFSVLDIMPGSDCLDALCSRGKALHTDFDPEGLQLLHQSFLFFGVAKQRADAEPPASVSDFQSAVGEASRLAFEAHTVPSSELQKDVMQVMQNQGLECEAGVVDPVTKYSMDVLVKDGSEKGIAVEVNDPSDFVDSGTALTPNGPTLLKKRLLFANGYKVVSVPFWEWSALDSETAKGEYIRNSLQKNSE